ncbi:small integral membrane protein 8 [Diaphorina citri]|uniref:Small integral membrane protein 8 n=1 Tax=Diaphorina citri TaxID=121845 RepID=A0A1S3DPJ1_DIACI|nr:small integral membrane protein 8 [Diaphorina citri]
MSKPEGESNVKPGDGIRSMKTSSFFKALNFELYATPNKTIMILGIGAITFCSAYIFYMRHKYQEMGYYASVDENE